uniref:Uncharacterized protein n=1 Tax=Ditylenchus dipsaci TaxID=166011 RepID=A0A915CLU7_9BILA
MRYIDLSTTFSSTAVYHSNPSSATGDENVYVSSTSNPSAKNVNGYNGTNTNPFSYTAPIQPTSTQDSSPYTQRLANQTGHVVYSSESGEEEVIDCVFLTANWSEKEFFKEVKIMMQG